MTDLKNNLEEVWNQEYRDFMLSFYPESSPLVSTWEIYRMAKIKSQEGIESIRTQLLAQCKITRELIVEKVQLEQQLQKTRKQLESANAVIHHVVYSTEDSQGLAYEYLELNKSKEINNEKQPRGRLMSNESMANQITDVPSAIAELLAVNKQLEQELQKTREQLEKADELLREVELLIRYDANKPSYENPNKFILDHAKYFKDKQGEG